MGGRGAGEGSCSNNEVGEVGRLGRGVALVDADALKVEAPAGDPTPERLRKAKNLDILRGFSANKPGGKPIALNFLFNTAPKAFAKGRVELTTAPLPCGKLPVDLVITSL